jgi:hypothetical protein
MLNGQFGSDKKGLKPNKTMKIKDEKNMTGGKGPQKTRYNPE